MKHRIFGKHVFVRWWNESEACYALGRGYARSLTVRTLSIMGFIALLAAGSQQLAAQNFTQITASHLQSDVSGVNVVRGKVCFLPTDQNDAPILVHDGAGGLVSASRPACATVTSGAIANGFQVANSATTNPAGIYYRIQVTDLCAACTTAGQVVHDLRAVPNVSGATWSLDSYVPTGTITPPLGNTYWDIPLTGPQGNPPAGFLRFYGNSGNNLIACLTSTGGNCSPAGGGGGYSTIQNAATSLATQTTVNFFSGITCANNSGQSRTDCQIDTSSGFSPNWAGNHTFNGNTNIAGGFKIAGGAAAGKIPIGDGTNFVPGDPLVQGLNAEGSTATNNPVNIGGFDTAGTPAIHGVKVVNGTPAGTEYAIVTRPIPSGTQTVSVSNTPTVTANAGTGTFNIQANASVNETQVAGTAIDVNSGTKSAGTQRIVIATDQPQLTNALKVDGSATTQPVSGSVTANIGTTNGLALDATLTGGTAKVKVTGNAGAALDAAGQNAASPANEVLVAGQFNTTPTTISTGNVSPLQMDSSGNLKVNIQSGGGTGGTASSFAAAFPASGTAIGVKNGVNMVNLTADGSSNLNVNCAAGCSAAGDQATGSTALGSNGAVITLPLTGDNKATFQLQSGGTGVYTVTPQCSFDGGTLYNVNGYIQDPVSAAISTTATIASAQATTDYPIICPQGASHAQMKVTAYTSGSANWVARATVNSGPALGFAAVTTAAPAPANNTVNPLSMNTAGGLRVDQTHVAGTAVDVNSGTKSAGTQRIVIATDQPQLTNALKVDGSATTQPVSGTLTVNAGTGNFAENLAQVNGSTVATAATGIAKVGLTDGTGNAVTSTSSALDVNIKSSGLSNQSVNINQVAGNAVAADANGRQILKVYPDTTTTSYHASKKFAASSTTDVAVFPGNATNKALLEKITLTCTQTTAGQINVEILKRSTADTAGTSASMTAVPDYSSYAAAVSAPLSYTGTGPTVGTAIGDLDNGQIGCMASGTATPNDVYLFKPAKPIILNGTAEQVTINLGGALTGGNITVTFDWRETTTP